MADEGMVKTSLGWLELKNYSSNPSDTDSDRGGVAVVSGSLKVFDGSSWSAVSGSGSSTLDGLTDTDISSASSAEVLVYDGSDSWDNKAISGDVSLSADGSTTVTDLTISGEAQGDILYFDGTNWSNLAAGTNGYYLKTQGAGSNPTWDDPSSGSALDQSVTIEAGTYDVTLSTTSQTSSAATLTIPDMGGTDGNMVISNASQTLTNKTLTAPQFANGGFIADNNGNEQIEFATTASAENHVKVTNAADSNDPEIAAAGDDTNVNLNLNGKGSGTVQVGAVDVVTTTGTQTLTNKTLTAPQFADGGYIADGSGNEQIVFHTTSSAVNQVGVTNSATANGVEVASEGDDSNVDLLLVAKGSGVVKADGAEVATISGTQTLTNKTLTTPTVNGVDMAYANKSGNYTASASDYTIDVSGASGGVTITLPSASGITGRVYVIKNSDASETVTIDGNGSEEIDGSTTVAMNTQYDFRMVQSDGTNWKVIASS